MLEGSALDDCEHRCCVVGDIGGAQCGMGQLPPPLGLQILQEREER